jgi:excisionase family DNA binding protein
MHQLAPDRIVKRAYRIHELKALGGPGRDRVYKLIKEGVLRAVKDGRNTLILHDDFERFLASRPEIVANPAPKSEPRLPRRRRKFSALRHAKA